MIEFGAVGSKQVIHLAFITIQLKSKQRIYLSSSAENLVFNRRIVTKIMKVATPRFFRRSNSTHACAAAVVSTTI